MRRTLILFAFILVGCYVGLSLWVRSVSDHQKHVLEQENRDELLITAHDPPLLLAVEHGDALEMNRLLKTGVNTEGADRAGHTPLLIAAREGDLPMVQQLLAAGARVEAQDRIGRSTLLYAVKAGRSLAVVRVLLTHGADAGHKDRAGETPLMLACDSADTEVMALLLEHGAQVNIQDQFGLTPLMRVARGISIERHRRNHTNEPGLMRQSAIQLLLEHGADVKPRDAQGWTALLYASENEPPEATQLLLKYGADPTITVQGRTPLRNAAFRGLVGNLQVLLANNVLSGKAAYEDALMQACVSGHDAAVQYLLDKGADINACDQYGTTPLMLAVANDHVTTAKLLLLRNANFRNQDIQGRGILDYAPSERRTAIRKELFGNARFRRF